MTALLIEKNKWEVTGTSGKKYIVFCNFSNNNSNSAILTLQEALNPSEINQD